MTEIAIRVVPKEIRLKLSRYTAKRRQEGSHERSRVGHRSYRQMRSASWYVYVVRSTGFIKVIQRPEGEIAGYGPPVRQFKGPL